MEPTDMKDNTAECDADHAQPTAAETLKQQKRAEKKRLIITYMLCFIALSLLAYGISMLLHRLSGQALSDTSLALVILAAGLFTALQYPIIMSDDPKPLFYMYLFVYIAFTFAVTHNINFLLLYIPITMGILDITDRIAQDM